MKKTLIYIFLFFGLISYSQNDFNQWTLSAGASKSFLRIGQKIPFRAYEKSFKFNVGGQFIADWGLLRRMSIGIGGTYQEHHLTIQNYEYELDGQTFTETPIQTVKTTGFTVRVLFHESDDDIFDYYFGLQQHFLNYTSSSNSMDPNFPTYNARFNKIPGIVAGLRYYLNDYIGLYGEFALPGAYTFSAGISVRIN